MITNLKTQKWKFSHKADYIEALSTNLDLKEGEGCLAKHGDGRNGGFAWRIHGFEVEAERFEGEGDERKLRGFGEERESESGRIPPK